MPIATVILNNVKASRLHSLGKPELNPRQPIQALKITSEKPCRDHHELDAFSPAQKLGAFM